jgi:tetratricopeptide (TPR) repeat protein
MRHKHFGYAPVIAAWLSIAFSGVAEAQPSDTMSVCLGRGGVTLDQRVDACSSIIKSGTATNEYLAEAHGNRGVARALRKEFESARQDYQESMRLNPSSGANHRYRANLYMFDGDEGKASEEYRKAVEIDPKQGPRVRKSWAFGGPARSGCFGH